MKLQAQLRMKAHAHGGPAPEPKVLHAKFSSASPAKPRWSIWGSAQQPSTSASPFWHRSGPPRKTKACHEPTITRFRLNAVGAQPCWPAPVCGRTQHYRAGILGAQQAWGRPSGWVSLLSGHPGFDPDRSAASEALPSGQNLTPKAVRPLAKSCRPLPFSARGSRPLTVKGLDTNSSSATVFFSLLIFFRFPPPRSRLPPSPATSRRSLRRPKAGYSGGSMQSRNSPHGIPTLPPLV